MVQYSIMLIYKMSQCICLFSFSGQVGIDVIVCYYEWSCCECFNTNLLIYVGKGSAGVRAWMWKLWSGDVFSFSWNNIKWFYQSMCTTVDVQQCFPFVLELPRPDFLNSFIYSFLAVLGLCCWADFFLVAQSGGYSLAVVCRLLIVVTSLVSEHSP